MPELPEVETIRLFLKNKIIDEKIEFVEVLNQKSFPADPKKVIGHKITKLSRIGKQLSLYLNNSYLLLIHLKMTGQLILVDKQQTGLGHPAPNTYQHRLPWKSTRVIFTFSDGSKLYFNDQRKFGWIKLVKKSQLKQLQANLGPDILSPGFTFSYFQKVVKSSGRFIKTFLHDQSKLAGVGNIYANDALFLSHIHPQIRCNSLTDQQIKNLHKNIKKVIKQGIGSGASGNRQYNFLVYQKQNQPCSECGANIKRIKFQGRSAFFCPQCQKN